MRVVALGLIAVMACRGDRVPGVTVTTSAPEAIAIATRAPPMPSRVAIRAAAHRVMSARCGECHESHRATAKPAALAVFDLDRPDWPTRFDKARFAAGLMRFGAAPAEDREAFVALRDAELAPRETQ